MGFWGVKKMRRIVLVVLFLSNLNCVLFAQAKPADAPKTETATATGMDTQISKNI
jgi:hypothetical protein